MGEVLQLAVSSFVGAFLGMLLCALLVFSPMMRHFFGRMYSEREELQKMHEHHFNERINRTGGPY